MALSFPKRRKPKDTIMLTSMMDMFTIILVFLLYNFSAEEQKEVKLPSDINMPQSMSEATLEGNAVNITVSKRAIKVEEKTVASIRNGRMVSVRTEGQKIVPLYRELLMYKKINQGKESGENDMILLKADKSVSFEVLDKVLKSAGMAGFPKSRFLVYRSES